MIVDNALYRDGCRVDLGLTTQNLRGVREAATQDGDFVWVGLHKPGWTELNQVGEVYGLHPLAIEDALGAHQRPKVERYDEHLFVVLKTLWYVDETDQVETGEISVFLGRDFVITVRHGEGMKLADARKRLEGMGDLLQHGPSAVLHTLCDSIVDRYEEVAADLQEDVDEVEQSVFSEQRTNDSRRIYLLKRELAEMRRAVFPLREPMSRFTRAAVQGVHPETGPYFRDVEDHLSRVAEVIDSLDNLLSTAFDAHIAQISIQQNDDMRRISAAVGLVAAPTLVAGIYGMNMTHFPTLDWTYALPFVLLLMLLSSFAVYVVSKRAGWL
ncbi:magnesium transport protein CorA [Marmoricola endophyticus]|uniref:Magnesium transport protein CorA n=1 Tax=Marmoricola endophyticus TaxID=2040280 RepID=A0A917BAA6_9ACTN|nr:magnesium/cobalt transporter CorA [Marmoricola endophyticus]GGF34210.1 magnesium transport protein CorA [Marmoricola endophyticus]